LEVSDEEDSEEVEVVNDSDDKMEPEVVDDGEPSADDEEVSANCDRPIIVICTHNTLGRWAQPTSTWRKLK
jgi:hypothetical protein